jgi:predicted nicotinamide N-methyase
MWCGGAAPPIAMHSMTASPADRSSPPRHNRRAQEIVQLRHQRRRLRLLHRIQRRYSTTTAAVTLGPLEFPFTRVADPDAVLDWVVAEEDRRTRLAGKTPGLRAEPQNMPYWVEVWDSALGLGTHLARQVGDLTGKRVLDLGCGQGLCGCAAAALGAAVLLADLEAPSLLFARLNSLGVVDRPGADRVRTRRLNWQTDALAERFDLILGADIIYDRTQWVHLERFWRNHLAAGGAVLLAEPCRPSGGQFLAWIAGCGWAPTVMHQPVPTKAAPVRLLRLQPPIPSP